MKYFIFIIVAFFSLFALADESCTVTSSGETVEDQMEIKTDVPAHLKGATITVTTADGRVSTVPAEKFKVVPRVQQFVVTKTLQQDRVTCSKDSLKNRVSLLAGHGPTEGLSRSKTATKVIVESNVGTIGGVQYQRLITNKISIGAQVQSNESALVNVGLDF